MAACAEFNLPLKKNRITAELCFPDDAWPASSKLKPGLKNKFFCGVSADADPQISQLDALDQNSWYRYDLLWHLSVAVTVSKAKNEMLWVAL